MPSNPSNLHDLLADLCDGTIDDVAFAQLEERLRADPHARRLYIQYMHLHAELAWSDGALSAMGTEALLEDAAALATASTRATMPAARSAPLPAPGAPARPIFRRIGFAAAAAMVVLIPTLFFLIDWRNLSSDPLVAVLTPGGDAKFADGFKPGDDLPAGRIVRLTEGSASLAFRAGSQVTLTGQTSLRLESSGRATLLHGTLAASVPPSALGFTVDAPNLRVIDLGTRFGVLAPANGDTQVHVFEGRVEVQPRVRLPRLFYNFDEATTEAADPFAGVKAFPLGGAARVKGIIGSGAMSFDNGKEACVLLGDGGSKEAGKGVFGVSDGITIEALIIPRWTGLGWSTRTAKPFDYDEIFRKEDAEHRIILCFQNDEGANQPLTPVVDPGPCLTFGLNLEGSGYTELDMPLDGQLGRPTLAELKDGKPHHVVASYDAATGIKAIYIDGTLRFRHRFAPGSRIVAGGPGAAAIGNTYGWADESFHGIIDEFAFYGAALTPAEVAGHWRSVQAGRNYFGAARFTADADGKHAAVIPLSAGQAMRFEGDTGLPVESVRVNEADFTPRR